MLMMQLIGCVHVPIPVHDLCTTMPYNFPFSQTEIDCIKTCLRPNTILYINHISDSYEKKCL